jgi:hypothetical protein
VDTTGSRRVRGLPVAVLAGMAMSALALGIAPVLMPSSYDWLAHTTSESAAQGVPAAWVARMGLGLFGASVLAVVAVAASRWNAAARVLHVGFALAMVATAAFSARSWDASVPYSELEDLAHSVAATVMGFAFAFGVFAVSLGRRQWGARRSFDVVAIVASVVLPLGMLGLPDLAGLLQRLMFVIAYAWYAAEAIAASSRRGPQEPAASIDRQRPRASPR